jgi:hypothetical protein
MRVGSGGWAIAAHGHAEAPATLEHTACTIMLGEIERSVRVVKDAIANGEIKLHGNFDGVRTSAYVLFRIIPDGLMIAVNNGCWRQIEQILLFHFLTLLLRNSGWAKCWVQLIK